MASAKPTREDIARGKRLKELREALGLSQADVLGPDRSEVSNVEHGRNQLTGGRLLMRYARGLGVDPEKLELYRDGKLTLEQVKAQRAAPAATAGDTLAMLKEAVEALEELDNLTSSTAWLIVKDVDPSIGSAFGYYRAARRDMKNARLSMPPSSAPPQAGRHVASKRR